MKYWFVLLIFLLGCEEYTEDIRQCAIVNLHSMNDSLFIEQDSTKQGLALMRTKLWYKDTINVGFLDGNEELKSKTLTTANIWSQYCSIVFIESSKEDADVRVTFQHGPSWSNVGTDCKFVRYPSPTLQLGWLSQVKNDEIQVKRVVLHEFGHVLGAIHEHQNPNAKIPWDSTRVYEYYSKSGWNKRMTDINVLGVQDSLSTIATRYDKNSIMLYAIPAALLKDPSYAVGWNSDLSETDKEFIGKIYPKKIVQDSFKIDSCIIMTVPIIKDTIIRTYKEVRRKIKVDSVYCKDTVIMKYK